MNKKMFLSTLILTIVCLTGCNIKTNNSHSHTYSENWIYDNTYHWHQASCEHSEVISNKAEHQFDEGVIVNPTYEEEGYIIYSCKVCNYQKQETIEMLEHNYSNEYSYDDEYHWNNCIDEGYEHLKINEEKHNDSNEVIIKQVTDSETGLAEYTCGVCKHTYQKELLMKASIITLPSVENRIIHAGESLESVSLNGGLASVDGYFVWTSPEEKITSSKEYSVSFVPNNSDKYATVEMSVYIDVTQLTVTVESSDNGSCNYEGIVNVDYRSDFVVEFIPDNGYQVASIIVDGNEVNSAKSYTFNDITSNHTLYVSFEEAPEQSNLSFQIEYIEGTTNAYTILGNTITFNNLNADSVYSISGELDGNIIIDIGDDYKLDLELTGFTLSSSTTNPIIILSGDEVSITAKSGYKNYINDYRNEVDSTDESVYSAAIYSIVDLEICGKGELYVESSNNNGIHTKDDLQVKNLTLTVKCVDNCLKGNDGIEITNANTTLIATKGDCIKSTNSHINETTLNQKGTISISGGTHYLYAACDGIDSAYDILIDDETTVLNIYTDRYSSYSEEVTSVSSSLYYIRYSSNAYSFSIKYYNSDTDYKWVNATYYTSVKSNTTYYFYQFDKLSNYEKMAIYMYSSTQTQGQDSSYYACASYMSLNDNYDTIELSYRQSRLSTNWNDYSSSSATNMNGGNGNMGGNGNGMEEEGNTDKTSYSTKGLKAANEITINNGTINIESRDDGIHANNEATLENGETALGNVTINGGNIMILSADDGIHADGNLIINNGNVSITNSYEGIEGAFITIAGGNVSIISSDDGMNGTATSGQAIIISGGKVYVYAQGDGIDSNSTSSYNAILFSGGNTVIICNSNGNSAIDSENGYNYTGGCVVAITSSGGMSSESTKCQTSSITTSTLSLTIGNYLVVSVNSATKAVIKMPCSLSAISIYLGSSSASCTASTSNSYTLDSNGVYWN